MIPAPYSPGNDPTVGSSWRGAEIPKGWLTFGHPGPSRLLLKTLEAGRLSHAYLITGPEQSGRKTLALDLARAVNCRPAQDLPGLAASPEARGRLAQNAAALPCPAASALSAYAFHAGCTPTCA